MSNLYNAEFHPVIEEFINGYVDDLLDATEKLAFEEVMACDAAIRELAMSAKAGKQLLIAYRKWQNNNAEGMKSGLSR